jgi:hypothetical protein
MGAMTLEFLAIRAGNTPFLHAARRGGIDRQNLPNTTRGKAMKVTVRDTHRCPEAKRRCAIRQHAKFRKLMRMREPSTVQRFATVTEKLTELGYSPAKQAEIHANIRQWVRANRTVA